MNDGRKKKPQKHKNKTAFKIAFDTQALQHHKKISLSNLCAKCTEIMEWKLQFNKYKKMTQPARCNICHQKNVYRTYMKACQICVQGKNICAKCLTQDFQAPSQVKVLEKDQKKIQKFMRTLQQRSRRTVRRGLQKGKLRWDGGLQYFLDEQGNKMSGLHFRKGFTIEGEKGDDGEGDDLCEDDDMFGDDDQEDESKDEDGEKVDKDDNKKRQNDKKEETQANKKEKKQEITGEKGEGVKGKDKDNTEQERDQDDDEDIDENEDDDESDVEGDEIDCDDMLGDEDEDKGKDQGKKK